jgi:uncharacterized membrane protein YebE (DUF533 family)
MTAQTTQTQPDLHGVKEQVSTSKFYMLRCVIAMAHADGIVTEVEKAYIYGIMNHLPLTGEQAKALDDDIKNAKNIEDLLPYINDPVYRGQVVDFARIMAYKDGHLDPAEDVLLKKLNAHALDGLDLEAIKKSVHESVARDMTKYDLKVGSDRPVKGPHVWDIIPWFQMLDEILLNHGIDLMDD